MKMAYQESKDVMKLDLLKACTITSLLSGDKLSCPTVRVLSILQSNSFFYNQLFFANSFISVQVGTLQPIFELLYCVKGL